MFIFMLVFLIWLMSLVITVSIIGIYTLLFNYDMHKLIRYILKENYSIYKGYCNSLSQKTDDFEFSSITLLRFLSLITPGINIMVAIAYVSIPDNRCKLYHSVILKAFEHLLLFASECELIDNMTVLSWEPVIYKLWHSGNKCEDTAIYNEKINRHFRDLEKEEKEKLISKAIDDKNNGFTYDNDTLIKQTIDNDTLIKQTISELIKFRKFLDD
jgi:hypothetical protein